MSEQTPMTPHAYFAALEKELEKKRVAMDAARYRWLLKTRETDLDPSSAVSNAWIAFANGTDAEANAAIDAALTGDKHE